MGYFTAIVALAAFVAGNIYLWSLKHEPLTQFWESLGIGVIAFPALFWLVTRNGR